MWRNFISSFILMVCALIIVVFAAGELLGILSLAKFGVSLLYKHCRLKYKSALQNSSFLFTFSYWWMQPWLALIIFNLFIPAVLTENIYWRYGTVTKHSCIVAKLAYVLLNFWLDNMFRTLHLGHHQVYRMFIRIQVNYCFCNVHLSL